MLTRLLLFLLIPALACTSRRNDDSLPIHMIFDAGSSGTRVCLFAVSRTDRCRASDTEFGCKDIKAENGLADLGPGGAEQTVRRGLDMLDESSRKRVTGAALLGTGGFRRISVAGQQAVLKQSGSVLLPQGYPSVLRVITGDEEGRLAWLSVREKLGSSKHTIVEIGGATVQIATGADKQIRSVSTPDGMNDGIKKLKSDSACFKIGRLEDCRKEIQENIFRNSGLRTFAGGMTLEEKSRPLYGLGAPWNAIFKTAGRNNLSSSDLLKQAVSTCGKSIADLSRDMPEAHAKRACYLHAYALELLSVTGQNQISQGYESWPRGAAVAGEYFDDCK
ncbi:MAG: hypothetical protein K8S54_06780 [Spirochaetia bacterium]|nr:hypothetical protein [Spirochaetia bacterium]